MDLSGAAQGWGEMSDVSYNDETWHSYTLSKENPKNVWITWRITWVLEFSPEICKFCYTKKYRYNITSNSFSLLWVFKYWFNKHGYNFDDVSKNGYSRSFWNKCFLKKRLWRHNFCPWRHQQNFIRWVKLYCRCDHWSCDQSMVTLALPWEKL